MIREFVIEGNVGGYYDEDGHLVVCEEYGLTDEDTDRYAIEVQNGDGFYSSDGNFVRYKEEDY